MSNNWKSCDNCADVFCPFTEDEACESWLTIECPRCSGPLSELRKYRYGGGPIGELARYHGQWYRHCYSCHAEFFEEE